MPGNTFGTMFRVTTWGESHGPALGAVVDGCPPGLTLTAEDINQELAWRRTRDSRVSTPRREPDQVEVLSGVFEGRTTGTPISLAIYNRDVDSSAYDDLKNLFRPGHADYTYWHKYGIQSSVEVAGPRDGRRWPGLLPELWRKRSWISMGLPCWVTL